MLYITFLFIDIFRTPKTKRNFCPFFPTLFCQIPISNSTDKMLYKTHFKFQGKFFRRFVTKILSKKTSEFQPKISQILFIEKHIFFSFSKTQKNFFYFFNNEKKSKKMNEFEFSDHRTQKWRKELWTTNEVNWKYNFVGTAFIQ